jgi:DNA-binding IclR family transcriptional regulator
LSVAVKRLSDVIEVLAESPQGATAQELAATLGLGRQAAARLLSAMAANRMADKDAESRRYRLSLRMYRWGSSAVARFVPAIGVRYEIAELAEVVQHPVFYAVLDGPDVVTVERTQMRGRQMLTSPDFRRNRWFATSSGRVLTAFQHDSRVRALMTVPDLPSRRDLEAELEQIRRQGFAASEAVRVEGYTLAAPIVGENGTAVGAIGIGVNKHVTEEREIITRKLLDTASRVSSTVSLRASVLNA